MADAAEHDDHSEPDSTTSTVPNTTPAEPGPDALGAVATATAAWTKATRAFPERIMRDRAIVAAFDAGATGHEVAAASGLSLDEIYAIHWQADTIRADAELDRSVAETSRKIDALATKVGADSGMVSEDMIREAVARLPKDSGVIRRLDPELADKMLRTYAENRRRFGL